MKMILFASALALSTAAIAQDATPAPTTPPPAMPATPDASAPATAPDATAAPTTAPATPDASAAPAAATDDSNLPTCSRTVTDKCKQGAKGGTHHVAKHAKHHTKKK